jgi:hypothetical protein
MKSEKNSIKEKNRRFSIPRHTIQVIDEHDADQVVVEGEFSCVTLREFLVYRRQFVHSNLVLIRTNNKHFR